MEIRDFQQRVWNNKVAKGFDSDNVPYEFCLLQGELAEAFDAWHFGRDNLADELADVAIYLASLAQMNDIDLQDAVEQKMAKNEARVYRWDDRAGVYTKVTEDDPENRRDRLKPDQ